MLRGMIYGASAAAIWGGMYVVSDVVLEVIPPFTLLLLRLIFGALSLGVFAIGKPFPKLSLKQWGFITLIGVIGYGISLGSQFVGTDLSTAINGAIVTSATPAFVVLFAVIILKEQLTIQRLLAVILATIGVMVIIDFSQADFSSETFVGNLFLGMAAISWGLYSILTRWADDKIPALDTLDITLVSFVGGFLLIIPASMFELSQTTINLSDITPGVIAGILFLGVVSTAIAFWLWNRAFILLDASTVSLLFFVQPISGAFLGWFFLGQAMTPRIWAGGALIAIGLLLSIPRKKTTPMISAKRL